MNETKSKECLENDNEIHKCKNYEFEENLKGKKIEFNNHLLLEGCNFLFNNDIIFADIESNGLCDEKLDILEFYGRKIKSGITSNFYCFKCKSEFSYEKKLVDEIKLDVSNYCCRKPINEYIDDLEKFIKNSTIIFWDVNNDIKSLFTIFRRFNKLEVLNDVKFIDFQEFYKFIKKNKSKCSLEKLIRKIVENYCENSFLEKYKLDFCSKSHNARDDT